MTDYKTLLVDASTGLPIAQPAIAIDSFSRVLSGCGTFTGTLPIEDPAADEELWFGDREITVLRDDVPVWNGPVTGFDPTRGNPTYSITAREPTWYFSKRVLEVDKTYSAGTDALDALRDILDDMVTKVATGDDNVTAGTDILAALPRWSVDGTTMAGALDDDLSFAGAPRYKVQRIVDLMAADPDTGFDYRIDYTTGSRRQWCHRTLEFLLPADAVLHDETLNEHLLVDFGRTADWEAAATRMHAVGSGYTKTIQNSYALTDGLLLLDEVADMSDTSDHSAIRARAREEKRLRRPPARTFSTSFTPSVSLPFDWVNLGERIHIVIGGPSILSLTKHRRVVEIEVTPSDGPEVVTLTYNVPLDETET